MNGCRLIKMAVEIVSESHVVTTPDYDVFPHIQSNAEPRFSRKIDTYSASNFLSSWPSYPDNLFDDLYIEQRRR